MSNRGLANKEKSREGHMDGMDAWGGREGVFVIERSRRDCEGTIWVGDRGSACAIERCPERNRDRPCTCLWWRLRLASHIHIGGTACAYNWVRDHHTWLAGHEIVCVRVWDGERTRGRDRVLDGPIECEWDMHVYVWPRWMESLREGGRAPRRHSGAWESYRQRAKESVCVRWVHPRYLAWTS